MAFGVSPRRVLDCALRSVSNAFRRFPSPRSLLLVHATHGGVSNAFRRFPSAPLQRGKENAERHWRLRHKDSMN